METTVYDQVSSSDNGSPTSNASREGPLGKSWKILASVNLFILSLKSKWRRRRRLKLNILCSNGQIYETNQNLLINNWTGSPHAEHPTTPHPTPNSLKEVIAMPDIQNVKGQSRRGSSRNDSLDGSSTGHIHVQYGRKTKRTGSACTTSSIKSSRHSWASSRRSTLITLPNINTRKLSVRNMWQNLTRHRNESPERGNIGVMIVDAKDTILPTSVTRQLAFGPWENAQTMSKFRTYLMNVPLAKVITLSIFLLCVIIVTVIYVKKAEVEDKLRRKYGWI